MKGDLFKQGKNICDAIDQLIYLDNNFLINKIKLYCKYCLSLGKEDVNSTSDGFYEECEDYLKELESNIKNKLEMEQFEKQFITSYESTLAAEGKEICKEVDSIIDDDELMVEKADTYSRFISYSKSHKFDPKLVDRCRKYRNDMCNYKRIKMTLEEVEYIRKENKKMI